VRRPSLAQLSRPPLPGLSRRNGAAVGAIAGVALAIGLIIGGLPGSSKGASPAGKVSGASTVQRRNLVATDTEAGTLSYAHPQTVFDRLSGTITWLPAIGHLVKPGKALFKVDGAPVVLFAGNTPAYRDLTSGVTNGADVGELNADLVALGFDPSHQITVDDTWQAATTTAVEAWQASVGETQTGTVTLGQIAFLPGPQRITAVNTVLGSNGGAAGTGTGTGTGASLTNVGQPRPQFVSLTTTTTTPSTTTTTSTTPAATCNGLDIPQQNFTTPKQTAPTSSLPSCNNKSATQPKTTKPGSKTPSSQAVLLALLKAETLELKKALGSAGGTGSTGGTGSKGSSGGGGAPSAASSGGGGGGSGAASSGTGTGGTGSSGTGGTGSSGTGGTGSSGTGGATPQSILSTTSTQLIVTVALDATKQSEAVVGEPVTVQMPSGNTVNGKITKVSPVAQTSSSSSSSTGSTGGGGSTTPTATIPVTITLRGHQPGTGLDQAAVSVNFQQQKANHVLSVPVTALLATAGGGYAIQQAASPHRLIAVTPGLFAAGYVQISGSQIYPGLQVTDSQG
jgi:Putative peptidoglycan binding domain